MKQYIIIKQIKINKKMQHYFTVLHDIYKINCSQFIRQAFIEKLKRDIPEIRKKHKEKDNFVYPF